MGKQNFLLKYSPTDYFVVKKLTAGLNINARVHSPEICFAPALKLKCMKCQTKGDIAQTKKNEIPTKQKSSSHK